MLKKAYEIMFCTGLDHYLLAVSLQDQCRTRILIASTIQEKQVRKYYFGYISIIYVIDIWSLNQKFRKLEEFK